MSYFPIIGNRFVLPPNPFIKPMIPSINTPIPKIGHNIHPIMGIIANTILPTMATMARMSA
jgi:hypothetical protein